MIGYMVVAYKSVMRIRDLTYGSVLTYFIAFIFFLMPLYEVLMIITNNDHFFNLFNLFKMKIFHSLRLE